MISMPNEYNVRISYNHISGLKPPIKCCNNLWIVYNIVSSSWCSFLRMQIYIPWGLGCGFLIPEVFQSRSTTLLTRGVALQGIKLCSLPENDTVGPVLIQIDVLCSRFVNAIELGKNTLIFSEFAWWIIATPILQPIWNLEKMRNTRRHLPSTNCWLSQSWVFRPLLLQRYMYYAL